MKFTFHKLGICTFFSCVRFGITFWSLYYCNCILLIKKENDVKSKFFNFSKFLIRVWLLVCSRTFLFVLPRFSNCCYVSFKYYMAAVIDYLLNRKHIFGVNWQSLKPCDGIFPYSKVLREVSGRL